MLESINSPNDLHNFGSSELSTLAQEIRERIIATVAENGGHLGANLGVVELTLALHRVLQSPRDKIIWDVGHQCYAHKLLTGRTADFATLRQYEGISGFPKRSESSHDCFGVGHSSTSISAAAGMAIARDLRGDDYNVVAVIGDGALTGGMALEALNHIGQLKKRLVVVLNDNEMSIGHNVGALSEYLNRLRLDPTLFKAREELEGLIGKIPAIGGRVHKVATGVKGAVKSLLPGQLFEELGFTYFGPFDGHNISQLSRALKVGLGRKGPVLIHVLTRKGKGYKPAEENPAKYHGVGPLNGRGKKGLKFSEVFGSSLVRLAETDPRVVAITAAMRDGTGLKPFARRYPDRFFDVGIAEQHALTLAAGMACGGLRPVVALYSTFLQRGYDQVLHDICLQNLPVVIGIDRAGVVGDDGPTHHGVFDISFLRSIPNLTLLAPKDGSELQAMLQWAVSSSRPVAIRYPRAETTLSSYPSTKDFPVEVLREGKDCTVLAVGNMVSRALAAARMLKPEIDCTVINVRKLKPLDKEGILHHARRSKKVITIEDNMIAGGFGSAVLELLSSEESITTVTLGYPDEFIPQGTIDKLHEKYGLTAQGIAETIRDLTSDKLVSAGVEGEL